MHRYCYHKERNYIFSYSQIVSYRALSDERPFFVLSTQSRNHCDIPLINKRRFSRRTASLYSNKRMMVVSERSFSFKKGALFPHSYDMEHPLIFPNSIVKATTVPATSKRDLPSTLFCTKFLTCIINFE